MIFDEFAAHINFFYIRKDIRHCVREALGDRSVVLRKYRDPPNHVTFVVLGTTRHVKYW